jgi:hypothetical protein
MQMRNCTLKYGKTGCFYFLSNSSFIGITFDVWRLYRSENVVK